MIESIADTCVDEQLDLQIRQLLTASFAYEPVFRLRRYCQEPPMQRWIARGTSGLLGHICIHRKVISSDSGELLIAGVGEVCVAPETRGNGLMKEMFIATHEWAARNNYQFSMLFGQAILYRSSGYQLIDNEIRFMDGKDRQWNTKRFDNAMVKSLSSMKWPTGQIDLRGPTF